MAVKAYITRDPAGNPWPPVHEHEATAAIGLIQRLYEAVNHEKTLYAVFANLQAPSADLVVLTELGMGVVELKHYSGRLSVSGSDWYAGGQFIKAGTGYNNPRDQVQAYATRIRRELAPYIAEWWSIDPENIRTALKIQSAVCFTNPLMRVDSEIKAEIEREASVSGRRWSAFHILTPPDFAAWVSTLRFGMEQDRAANFAPHRLKPKQINALAQAYFKGAEWTEIRNLMPTATPYAYLSLRQAGQEPQLFPLRSTTVTVGRDNTKCALLIPEVFRRVSREHIRLTRVAGAVWIEDLGSSQGTYVNGARVEEIAPLTAGQRITLGGPEPGDRVCELVFAFDLPPELQAGATAADQTASQS